MKVLATIIINHLEVNYAEKGSITKKISKKDSNRGKMSCFGGNIIHFENYVTAVL